MDFLKKILNYSYKPNIVVAPWNKGLLIDLDRYEIRLGRRTFTDEDHKLMKKLQNEGLELEYDYKQWYVDGAEPIHIKKTIKFDAKSIIAFEAIIKNSHNKYNYIENKEFITLEELFVIVHGMIKGPCYCMGFSHWSDDYYDFNDIIKEVVKEKKENGNKKLVSCSIEFQQQRCAPINSYEYVYQD